MTVGCGCCGTSETREVGMRAVSWDEVKNASACGAVYLDGSGSTVPYWDSDAGQAFLRTLRRAACSFRILWLDDDGRQRPLGPDTGKPQYQSGGAPDLTKIWNAMFITDTDLTLTAIQQRDIANHNIEVVTFRQLGIDYPSLFKAERPARPAYPLWNFDATLNRAEELADRITEVASASDLLRDCDNKQARNKKGVELYVKLERLTDDLSQLSTKADPAFLGHYSGWIVSMQGTVERALDRLLREVFEIPAETIANRKTATVSHGTLGQPHGTRTETYSNGDVAGVTIEYCGQQFTGSAKRNPVDKPNPTIGLAVAEAKAARKLAVSLQQAANKMVADADRNRRKEQAAKATAKNQRRREQQEASDRKNATRYRQENERLVNENNKLKSEANRPVNKNVSEAPNSTTSKTTRRPATPKKAPRKRAATPKETK